MGILVRKDDNGRYIVKETTVYGDPVWITHGPMSKQEAHEKLIELNVHIIDVSDALRIAERDGEARFLM